MLASLASLAVVAQQPGKIPRVGVLRPGNPPPGDFGHQEAFEGGLRELGWKPGANILIEYRYGEGKPERIAELANELVQLPVDLIVASSPVGVRAAQRATRTIPIVISTLPDPVGEKLVASLARPGGNTTGLALDSEDLAAKQLELLKEALPRLSRVAILRNAGTQGFDAARRTIESVARRLNVEIMDFPVTRREELAPAFSAMRKAAVGAILVRRDVLVVEPNRAEVVQLAAQNRLPAMYSFRQFPDSGGLMSYGANVNEIHRRSAGFVDRILKGAKPADLPIEQPTKFELVVNMKAAKALGISLAPSLLLRVDQVVE